MIKCWETTVTDSGCFPVFILGDIMRKRKEKKIRYVAAVLAAVILTAGCGNVQVGEDRTNDGMQNEPEEEKMETLQGSLMVASEDTQGREEPDEKAEVIVNFPAGSSFLVTGEENGWSRIYYQGQILFVPEKALTAVLGEDGGELDEELQKSAEEGATFISSLEKQRSVTRHTRVWRIVIVVLVAAVFVSGLTSSLKKGQRKKRDQGNHGRE